MSAIGFLQGEETAVIICKYLTIDVKPDEMKQVFKKSDSYSYYLFEIYSSSTIIGNLHSKG